jgi:putative alpha-1,2-mannosidase
LKLKIVLLFFTSFLYLQALAIEPLDFVDPNIGVINSRWFFNAPVSVPNGLISGGPIDSGFGGYSGGGSPIGTEGNGFHRGFVLIKGFQIGEVLILPKCIDDQNFITKLVKDSEKLKPNYYETIIKDGNYKIKYKVTATKWTAKFNIEWDCKNPIIYVSYGNALGESGLKNEENTRGDIKVYNKNYAGYSENKPPYSIISHKSYFYVSSDNEYFLKRKNKYYAVLASNKNNSDLNITLSYTGVNGAVKNYEAEAKNKSFEEVKNTGQKLWSAEFKKFSVIGPSSDKKIFYTSLWNALRGKSIINDYDGSIPVGGNIVYSDISIYNSDSMWGGNFNITQLWGIFYPELAKNFGSSLVKIRELYGHIPDGWAINGPVQGMGINTSLNYLGAIRNFSLYIPDLDTTSILSTLGVKGNQAIGYKTEGADSFYKYGYVPLEDFQYGAGAHTIELSYANNCALNLIENNTSLYKTLQISSNNYKNIFDINNRAYVPKLKNGKFKDYFNEMSGSEFAEGNARQYFWSNPYALLWYKSFISNEYLKTRLTKDLEDAEKYNFSKNSNVGGYSTLKYNHGNQVALNAVFGFHIMGYPNLTRKYSRSILSKFYGVDRYHGYGYQQDEDQGQLSAWYVMASIGMYDYFGGCVPDPTILLIPPLFKSVVVKTNNLDFTITNNSDHHSDKFKVYIDGKLHDPQIKLSKLRHVKNIIYEN